MDSKLILFLPILALGLAACDPRLNLKGDENIIGNKLTTVSPMITPSGDAASSVALFDNTTRQIHQFKVDDMSLTRTLEVRSPDEEHYLLFQNAANYVIDLSLKSLSIFDSTGAETYKPISFAGAPVSAAFRPELNLLVVYDDLSEVGIVKMDSQGHVVDSWVGGSLISDPLTIRAGDVTAAGKLVLSLSDDSISVVDIDQTLAQKQWVSSNFPTTLKTISWLAPVPDNADLMMAKSENTLSLININTKTVGNTADTTDLRVEKASKSYDPHVIYRDSNEAAILYYVTGTTISSRKMIQQPNYVLSSYLNRSRNWWTFVDTTLSSYAWFDSQGRWRIYNDLNAEKTHRSIKRFRFSDMLVLTNKGIPTDMDISMANDYFFALFPSKLGLAKRYSVETDDVLQVQGFNIKQIGKRK